MAPHNIYALLVGINDYPAPVPALRGCLNDVSAMEQTLRDLIDTQQATLDVKVLLNQQASRDGVVAAIRSHLGQAGPGDAAVLYYSGHGSLEKAPAGMREVYLQTLVCHDSRLPGGWDLADKEMKLLLRELSGKGGHLLVILDSCHSGSGTRAAEDLVQGCSIRRCSSRTDARPEGSFLDGALAAALAPSAPHTLLAACEPYQQARELEFAGVRHGVFTYYLLRAMRELGTGAAYRDLQRHAYAAVMSRVSDQVPKLEDEGAGLAFLGGASLRTVHSVEVRFDVRRGCWVAHGGGLTGLEAGAVLDVMGGALPGEQDVKAGTARVEEASALVSRLSVTAQPPLLKDRLYHARVVSRPRATCKVALEGDAVEALDALRPYLTGELAEARTDEACDLRVTATNGQYEFRLFGERRLVTRSVDFGQEHGSKDAAARLRHIARWLLVKAFSPPAATCLGDASLEVVVTGGRSCQGGTEYRVVKGEQLDFTFTNRSSVPLYCCVLDLAKDFSVGVCTLTESGDRVVQLEPAGSETVPLAFGFPDGWENQGTYLDLMMVLASTSPFDQSLLDDLTQEGTEAPVQKNVLNPVQAPLAGRWLKRVIPVFLEAAESNLVPGTELVLSDGAITMSHSRLRAKVRLAAASTGGDGARDIPYTVPPSLEDFAEPLRLQSDMRGGASSEQGVSLEIAEPDDASVVSLEDPMVVSLNCGDADRALVLPFALVDGHFVPVGFGFHDPTRGAASVLVHRLPIEADGKSLLGSIRLFFQKISYSKLGIPFPYPVLARALVSPAGVVSRPESEIKELVRDAGNIAVFIHGIIGDTDGMLPSVSTAFDETGVTLGAHFDLVLAFDYENLNTTIPENARLLKKKLMDVGIGVNGKRATLIAHSMGGLISRWMIEKEDGSDLVERLIMLGTPNNGSPLPRVVDQLESLVCMAANGVAWSAPWPGPIVRWLLRGMARVTSQVVQQRLHQVTLDEMDPTRSTVLSCLRQSPAPGIPYFVVAGNVLAQTASPPPRAAIVRVLTAARNGIATTFLFAGQPHDIAVSVDSIKSVPQNGHTKLVDVACDHCSYFVDPASLKALYEASVAP